MTGDQVGELQVPHLSGVRQNGTAASWWGVSTLFLSRRENEVRYLAQTEVLHQNSFN